MRSYPIILHLLMSTRRTVRAFDIFSPAPHTILKYIFHIKNTFAADSSWANHHILLLL